MPERSKILAKAKTKAAVKRKPAKTQVRATTARVAKAPKKTAATKPAKAGVKVSVAKPAKASAAKAATSVVTEVKVAAKPPVERKTGPLTLPAAKQSAAPVASPPPVVRKTVQAAVQRADLPPPDGFTLLVDGHFKNQFDDLKGAKAAATELKSRFPMLRVEIYDAANKARLPA
jgi:hypothetical protein